MLYRRKPEWQVTIAKERIRTLFKLAEKEFNKHPERSKRYIELTRRIGLRYNVRLPKEIKRKFCKNCNTLFLPGVTFQTRIKKKLKIIKCLKCNKIYRYPIGG